MSGIVGTPTDPMGATAGSGYTIGLYESHNSNVPLAHEPLEYSRSRWTISPPQNRALSSRLR